MATEADVQATKSTYLPRNTPFVKDEGRQELGQENTDENDFNRTKITQRDLGSLSVIGSLTSVQYGKWAEHDACLVGFRFQFQQANAARFRFEAAEIVIEFQARPPGKPDNDPAVVRYGPKSLQSAGTSEDRSWHWTAALSASAGAGPGEGGAELEFGKEGSYTRQYAGVVWSDDWGNRKHRRPNCLKIWMREDSKQKDGIAPELRAAIVVQTNRPFQASVSIKVDSVFNLLAQPWTKDDPVLLQPGIGLGAPLREGAAFDFSSITSEEWRQLVTPELVFRNTISYKT